MDIYDKIKHLRESKKMSQEELAEKMGYKSKTSIHKIEQKKTDIPLSKVKDFAKVLNTTPEYLMGWEEKKETVNPYFVDTSVLTEQELEEFNRVTGVNKQLFFNDVDEEHDMALFKQAVVDLLVKKRENKK